MDDWTAMAGAGDGPSGRVVVLLGAGASADAELMLTSQLAEEVVRRANAGSTWGRGRERPGWVQLLNAIYAGMVGYRGAHGDDPLTAVNIETLISAVRLLQTRDTHEVAPFVANWAPSLTTFGSTDVPEQLGRGVIDAMTRSPFGHGRLDSGRVARAVAAVARQAVRPDIGRPLHEIEKFILRTLVTLLGAHKRVDYLKPLMELASEQAGGLDVITLNYDLTIETVAASEGVAVNRGIDSWKPGGELEFPEADGTLNLLKLHGSLDWRANTERGEIDQWTSPRRIDVVPLDKRGRPRDDDLPWIVVGDREKLATDGPTLALNHAARGALARARHLAIVGYSFGDAHINAMIRDWVAGDPSRTISILDKEHPREYGYRPVEDFRSALVARYARQWDSNSRRIEPKVALVEGTAAERLKNALLARPAPAPDPVAITKLMRADARVEIDVTWLGVDLSDATMFVSDAGGGLPAGTPPLRVAFRTSVDHKPTTPAHVQKRLDLKTWKTGATVTIEADEDVRLPIEVRIAGASIIGKQGWAARVEDDTAGPNVRH